MKKLFILIIYVLLINLSAICQISVTASTSKNHNVDNVVIKEYAYPVTITSACSHNDIFYYTVFSYNDATRISYDIELDGYIVHDFVIDDDSVFFCGQSENGYGIIGFFDINDLFFNNGSFYIQNTFLLDYYEYAGNLVKLVTYKCFNPDSDYYRHIVSVGYGKNNPDGCMVDMYYYMHHWESTNGILYGSFPQSLKDVTVVGDYLVTAGYEAFPYLTLRSYRRGEPFSMTGPQDHVHTFHTFATGDERFWDTANVLLTPISNTLFATASLWNFDKDYYSQKNILKLHIAEYNLLPLLSYSSSSMFLSSEAYFPMQKSLKKLYAFTAAADNSGHPAFGILLETTLSKGLFFEIDMPSLTLPFNIFSSYTGGELCTDQGLEGLDNYNGRTQYVMSGHCKDISTLQTFEVETSGVQSNCMPAEMSKIDPVVPVISTVTFSPYYVFGNILALKAVEPSRYDDMEIVIDCYE